MPDAPDRAGTRSAAEHWERFGWAWCAGVLTGHQHRHLVAWVDEIERWPTAPGRWLQYYERDARQATRLLSRVENFTPYHPAFAAFIASCRELAELLELALGEPACLFKDKLNVKPPGGAPYAMHQDAPAYDGFGIRSFVTAMIPVDDMTPDNGCLYLPAAPRLSRAFAHGERGEIAADDLRGIEFVPVLAKARDVVVFDGLVPHRSGPNASRDNRRALFLTFNGVSGGDQRGRYYEEKRRRFPPEAERPPDWIPSAASAQFNLGNPFD